MKFGAIKYLSSIAMFSSGTLLAAYAQPVKCNLPASVQHIDDVGQLPQLVREAMVKDHLVDPKSGNARLRLKQAGYWNNYYFVWTVYGDILATQFTTLYHVSADGVVSRAAQISRRLSNAELCDRTIALLSTFSHF